MKLVNNLIPVLLILVLPNYAYAYIDPGTGSFILQAILAFFATVVVYLGYPIRFVKSLYNKFFKRKIKKDHFNKEN